MALVDLASVQSMLACPRCRSELVRGRDAFWCSSPECTLVRPEAFPVVGQWPVFVDFEHSIIRREGLGGSSSTTPPARTRWSVERLPRRLRSWWKPPNRVAARNVDLLLSLLSSTSPLILVVGGGAIGNGMGGLYRDRRTRLFGFDIYGSSVTQFIADAHQIPLASNSVDAVIVQAVLEHVLDPRQVVNEIHRVLRPHGLVYAETPFLQQIHAGPYDFMRYTCSGHRYLFRAFEEVAAGPVAGPGTQMLWSVDHLVRGLLRSQLAGRLARGACFWMRYLDRLVPTAFAVDAASACYFLGRRGERELSPSEIVAYYRGAQRPLQQ